MTTFINEASAGNLSFDPEAALEGHKAIVAWVGELNAMLDDAVDCAFVSGFPEFSEAQQLAEKFVGLAAGDNGVRKRITQFTDVALEIAELFRLSIEKFALPDTVYARYLDELDSPPSKAVTVAAEILRSPGPR